MRPSVGTRVHAAKGGATLGPALHPLLLLPLLWICACDPAAGPPPPAGSDTDLHSCPVGDGPWRAAVKRAQKEGTLEELIALAGALAAERPDRWEPVWAVAECLFVQEKATDARREYREALERARRADDQVGLACAGNRLGWLAFEAGDLERADRDYRDALAAARAAGRDDLAAFVLNNLAGLLWRTGDLAQAGRVLTEAEAALHKLGMAEPALTCEYNRGVVLLHLGDARAAYDVLAATHAKFVERGAKTEAARAAVTLGRLLLLEGRYDAARAWLLRVSEEIPAQHVRAGLYLGRAALLAGDLDGAVAHLDRTARETSDQLTSLLAETWRAEVDLRRHRPREAGVRLGRVITAAEAGNAAEPLWLAKWLQGRQALQEQRPAQAVTVLRQSVAMIEQMGTALDPATEGLRFLRERAEPYADLAATLAGGTDDRGRLERVEEVLAVVEKAHGRSLNAAAGGAGEGEIASATVASIRRGLSPGELLLDYLIGEERGVLVAIRAEGARALPLPGWGELREPLRRYRAWLEGGVGTDDTTAGAAGGRLSEILLAPVRGWIEQARRIYFVPDGELALVPPAALRWTGHGGGGSTEPQARFLGDAVETAVLVKAGIPPAWDDLRPPLLLAGDPLADEAGEFPELPYSSRELAGIAELWAGEEVTSLSRERFTPEELESLPLGRFRILHLATHAVASTRSPGRCAVILSGGKRLGFDQVARLPLGPALVILSACRTGEGEVLPGEGVLGLSWAFLRAGATGIAASLWRTHDAASARLMISFHRALREHRDPVAALASAEREAARSSSHPSGRAPFVLVLRPSAP